MDKLFILTFTILILSLLLFLCSKLPKTIKKLKKDIITKKDKYEETESLACSLKMQNLGFQYKMKQLENSEETSSQEDNSLDW